MRHLIIGFFILALFIMVRPVCAASPEAAKSNYSEACTKPGEPLGDAPVTDSTICVGIVNLEMIFNSPKISEILGQIEKTKEGIEFMKLSKLNRKSDSPRIKVLGNKLAVMVPKFQAQAIKEITEVLEKNFVPSYPIILNEKGQLQYPSEPKPGELEGLIIQKIIFKKQPFVVVDITDEVLKLLK